MTEQDIIKAQNLWSEGIIKMGQISSDRKSLEIYASDFLDRLYNFDDQVLFKLFLDKAKADTYFASVL